ncbi:putative oxidoreductase YyaE [Collibacillus ludicampi]|uniref:Oxidoreductase YyaE n=1 Tax=Collibacillus ludicampi TaxID=2771369 RepID=A0AAV4LDH1_9BACL|nr:molybdopterin-dependent oxidoreductase [Collibacillus ludicampi]GIM45875.1 putative oxidoreductase YyaE [Collibacillus ludicampi]
MAEHRVLTACPLDCWDACSMVAYVHDGRLIKVEGNPDHPITQGSLCVKGKRLVDRLYHPKRILSPLKKVNGEWIEIEWEQAFREIAAKMREASLRYGPTAVMHMYDYGSGGMLKALEERFFNLFGGYTEIVGSLCWEAGLQAQTYDFGIPLSHHPNDLVNARAIVVWGRNVSVTNMHMMPFIKKALKRGTKLVLVNPLATDLSSRCDLQIRPRPGTDGALALGVARIIYERGTYDHEFVEKHAVGFSEFASYLQQFSPERVSEITGVPVSEIEQLAELYENGPVSTLLGIGLQRYGNGGNTIRAIDALCAMSGQVGKPGGGVQYANRIWGPLLDMNALTMPERRTAHRVFSVVRQAEEILQADPPVEILFVTRSNPISQIPNSKRTQEAYQKIGTVVVIDMFLNDTAEYADYFLPCTTVFEEEDILYSSMWHSTISYIHPVVPPQGKAKPDWQIFAGLAEHLGFADEFMRPIHEWMEMVIAPLKELGVTLERLQEEGFATVPSEEIPFSDHQFPTPSGKYEFYSRRALEDGASALPEYKEPLESPVRQPDLAVKYPYHLLSVHPRRSLNTQHYLVSSEQPWVEVSPDLARKKRLSEGDRVRVFNERGAITGILKITPLMHPHVIKIEQGRPRSMGGGINDLTSNHHADLGKAASAQYDCLVNIEKIDSMNKVL